MTVTHLVGDALTLMRSLPDASVDAVIGSPPFLALRNYNDLPGQWGSEPDPASFLANLLTLALETRRVLTPTGSLAFELGDSYSGSGGAGGDYNEGGWRAGQPRAHGGIGTSSNKRWPGPGWPLAKSMTLAPTLFPACLAYGANLLDPATSVERAEWIIRLAGLGMSARSAAWFADQLPPARQFDPWRVRNLIVWARNNPPVGALGDKFRLATSYITVACMSERRWFDLDAVRTAGTEPNRIRRVGESGAADGRPSGGDLANPHKIRVGQNQAGAPPLDHWWDEPDGDLTWLINTQGSSLAHYAMWPPRLAERLVLSMVPREVCRVCGEPRRRITGPAEYVRTDTDRVPARLTMLDGERPSEGVNQHTRPDGANTSVVRSAPTLGWSDCGHGDYRHGVVLDPFAGTGTTLAVADIHGRDAIGFDLDPGNQRLYPIRHRQVWKALGRKAPAPVTPAGQQASLW